MKVRLLGFTLECGQGIDLTEFLSHLETQNGVMEPFLGSERILYTKPDGDYQLGLFVSVKDQKKFCELRQAADSISISVLELEAGTSLIDFNYFLLNRQTGRGLYQYYHNSCALSRFVDFCKGRYNKLKLSKTNDAIMSAGGNGIAESKKKKIRSQFKGTLSYRQMVRPGELAALMQDFEQIKAFEFDLTQVEEEQPLFQPVQKYIKQRKIKLSFQRDAGPVDALRNGILKIVKKNSPKNGHITGEDASGEERTLKIFENFTSFGEYEFDEIAQEMQFNLDAFEKSKMMNRLLGVVRENTRSFEAPEQ